MAEKETQFDKIKRLSSNQKHIRNIATSAHIHHGKTAMTDNLLAASGHMAEKSAGNLEAGMATWQHSDEQERLMTVDAANVSMVHNFHGDEYLINLIDTPGHVDFSGNVTRAMRAIDGTVVLVCAVEGIMPQTETVIKQALRERVRPVLFINKVDRLIKELKLTPEKMQQRFIDIFHEFNELIRKIAEPEFKEKWKVDINDGSVAFGSARENWALSVPFMKKKGITFKDIFTLYEMNEEDKKHWVWKNAPLYEVLLDMVVKHLPDPVEAQAYRIPKIWHGELDSDLGKSLLKLGVTGINFELQISLAHDQFPGRGQVSLQRVTDKEGHHVVMGRETCHHVLRFFIGSAEIADDAYEIIVFCKVQHFFEHPVQHSWIRLDIPIHPKRVVHLQHGLEDPHDLLAAAMGRDFTDIGVIEGESANAIPYAERPPGPHGCHLGGDH